MAGSAILHSIWQIYIGKAYSEDAHNLHSVENVLKIQDIYGEPKKKTGKVGLLD